MLDQNYINELKELPKKEAKAALIEYAKTDLNIELKKLKSGFDVLVVELKTKLEKLADVPMPEQDESGLTIGELIDADDEIKGEYVADDVNPKATALLKQEVIDTATELMKVKLPNVESVETDLNDDGVLEITATYKPEPTIQHIQITQTIVDEKPLLPKDFSPSLVLIGPAPGYTNIPYWVYDFIVGNADWKTKIESCPHTNDHKMLYSLLYYIQKNGNVKIRESRNSGFHIIE